MRRPRCTRTKARLVKCEAKIKAYENGRLQKMQEQAGIKVEMNGEAPTGILSGKTKARNAKTRLEAVNYQGKQHTGAKEALKATSEFYLDLFTAKAGPGGLPVDFKLERSFPSEDATALRAPWEEEEIKWALAEMATGSAKKASRCGHYGAGKLTYLGYADDTTFLLKGRMQLGMAEKLLRDFEQMSGLEANCDKTVVMPLGRQRDEPPLPVSPFKWTAGDEPERLLGVWITSGGDAKPSWKKALRRMETELKKREEKYLTTTARVAVINAYVMPIAPFQAQVYPPPDTIWEELRRLCHAFVSGGRASVGPGFILWSAELMQMRSDGGLGVINLRNRLDARQAGS
ncbi:unnamed protein product [Closterium sp. NIES-65]|nr:unnamed protein product [Closterium sp. NIES-65]